MSMEDLKILEAEHDRAVREVQNVAVNIAEKVVAGEEVPEAMRLVYRAAKGRVLRVKADLARALENEFDTVLRG